MAITRARIHRLLLLVTATVAALVLLTPAGAEAAGPYFELRGFNGSGDFDQKCASVGGASRDNGAPVVSWSCAFASQGHPEQIWRWNGDTIVNSNSGRCLAIDGNSHTRGARVVQFGCGVTSVHWEKVSAGAGRGWILRNKLTDLVLAVAGGSRDNGTWIVQWPYSNGPEQKWEEHHI